jgi:hypothetical protein
MKKINWKYKNVYVYSDGTGFVEDVQNSKTYNVEFNWTALGLDDYDEMMNLDIELGDIDVYDFKTDSNETIKVDEYKEELEELIHQYINENLDRLGFPNNLEDLKEYLKDY